MKTEQFILNQLIQGKQQQEIPALMKEAGIKPNSLRYVELKLKAIRDEHNAKTMFHLGAILAMKRRLEFIEYLQDALKS